MSEEKIVLFGELARKKMAQGVYAVARAVGSTYGPQGRTVLIEAQWAPPLSTRDGVTVVKAIELADALENQGAQFVKYGSIATYKTAGDGTTTTVLLTEGLVQEGLKALAAGCHPVPLTEQLAVAQERAFQVFQRMLLEPTSDRLLSVASIAARDIVIGRLILDALQQAGADGEILLEASRRQEHNIQVKRDYEFTTAGYHSKLEPPDSTVTYPSMAVLIGERFDDIQTLYRLLRDVAEKPLLLVGRMDKEIQDMLLARRRAGIPTIAAFPPGKGMGHGDALRGFLDDFALLAETIPYAAGTRHTVTPGWLENVIIKGHTITFNAGGYNARRETIVIRLNEIRASLNKATSDYEKGILRRRLAFLSRPLVILGVGGTTPTEVDEITFRFEDALLSVRHAQKHGVLPGGNAAFLAASKVMPDTPGGRVLAEALRYPLRQLLYNAGLEPLPIISRLLDAPDGMIWDIQRNCLASAEAISVLDSVVAVRAALQHAIDVATGILLTDSILVEKTVFWS